MQNKLHYYWSKIAQILLMIHGAYGLWEALKFLVFEYPHLEDLLRRRVLSEAQAVEIAATGIFVLLASLISITMAWRLHATTREDVANEIDLIVATFILISAPFASTYLAQLPWLQWFENYFL